MIVKIVRRLCKMLSVEVKEGAEEKLTKLFIKNYMSLSKSDKERLKNDE